MPCSVSNSILFQLKSINRTSSALKPLAAVLLLSCLFTFCFHRDSYGFVVSSEKILADWIKKKGKIQTPLEIPILWNYKSGKLYVSTPGKHAIIFSDGTILSDSMTAEDPLAALWRAADLFAAAKKEDLDASLAAAGINIEKSGYARTDRSSDGVGHTVGAKGEGDNWAPQILFSRDPFWLCLVRIPGAPPVEIGPVGPYGWPDWFLLGHDNLIQLKGAPAPALINPPRGGAKKESTMTLDGLPSDWRKAFDDLQQ